MEQIRLVYASVVRGQIPSHNELADLLRGARANNANLGITGALFYAQGSFLQALEGERSSVNRLYARIAQDSRHQDCEILLCNAIDRRWFAQWSMNLIALDSALIGPLHELSCADAEQLLREHGDRERRTAVMEQHAPGHS
jgi:hypothetical protein